MNEQCNTCGSFADIVKCSYCPTMVCVRCKPNHERVCEEMQKRKARGEGPTVRNPGMTRVEPADLGLAGVKDLLAE